MADTVSKLDRWLKAIADGVTFIFTSMDVKGKVTDASGKKVDGTLHADLPIPHTDMSTDGIESATAYANAVFSVLVGEDETLTDVIAEFALRQLKTDLRNDAATRAKRMVNQKVKLVDGAREALVASGATKEQLAQYDALFTDV